MAVTGLTFENEVFSKFAFYAAVVLLKTVLMSAWTAVYRIRKKVFANPEDYAHVKLNTTTTPDPHIERIRRCHLNDLENVLPFVFIGLLYVLTEPDGFKATLHFQIFAAARLLHTIVYLNGFKPPVRGILWTIVFLVNMSMLITVLASGTY